MPPRRPQPWIWTKLSNADKPDDELPITILSLLSACSVLLLSLRRGETERLIVWAPPPWASAVMKYFREEDVVRATKIDINWGTSPDGRWRHGALNYLSTQQEGQSCLKNFITFKKLGAENFFSSACGRNCCPGLQHHSKFEEDSIFMYILSKLFIVMYTPCFYQISRNLSFEDFHNFKAI